MLLTILDALDPARVRAVVAYHAGSRVEELLRRRGHTVQPVNLPVLTFHGGPRAMLGLAGHFAAGARQLFGLIRRHGVAAVHATGLTSALYGGVAARLARVPLIWHVHEMLERRPRNVPFVRLAAAMSRSIVCVSAAARARLVAFGVRPGQCRLVYNALPSRLMCSRDPSDAATHMDLPDGSVLAVGAITPLKGHAVLVEAARELVPRYPALVIAIAGEVIVERDRGYFDQMRERIIDHGLEHNVRLLGFRRDVEDLIARAAVVVQPSVEDEPLPLVPLEAMAAGRPVVASRIGGLPEIVADGISGILVEPGRSGDLARAIGVLLEDGALRERMGGAGREIVAERFSAAQMIQGLNDVFTAAIGTPILRDPRPA